ncbi:hemerythrin domain-containing protein [Paractinoplanes atraurantiacus]|uniref:Hemerythrin-like domain-containing protein n=1 Tax=Paractinoplanes atraurantiacus TaxID=1036182 RepID=A0A285KC15_9ACTN|nr:hemerythrin domain-containing protein [Actinoplanes atraurantiacus]SNY68861.1 Hemerythrin-like domain-containing protein [Actinoplanes atraurantiacus]
MDNEPTGLLLAHRAMLKDLDRLSDLTASLATGGTRLDRKRAAAIAGYLSDFCDSIHHHHSAEDDVLWPVLERSAGAHVDLTELTDDHAVLDPKLTRVRTGAAALRETKVVPAELAADMKDLRDTLHEHIADEERTIVPLIKRYVSDDEWNRVEASIRKRGAKMTFEVPRILAVSTPAELAEARKEGGLPVAIMIKVFPLAFRKRERLVFSPAGA